MHVVQGADARGFAVRVFASVFLLGAANWVSAHVAAARLGASAPNQSLLESLQPPVAGGAPLCPVRVDTGVAVSPVSWGALDLYPPGARAIYACITPLAATRPPAPPARSLLPVDGGPLSISPHWSVVPQRAAGPPGAEIAVDLLLADFPLAAGPGGSDPDRVGAADH